MSAATPGRAHLHNYNHELVECIEDLRRKREEVDRQICKEEDDKAKIQKEVIILQDRLQKLNESLARKIQARTEYDKTIQETEAAYTKILESAQTLLHVLKRESVHLGRRVAVEPPDGTAVDNSNSSSSGAEFAVSSSFDRIRKQQHSRPTE